MSGVLASKRKQQEKERLLKQLTQQVSLAFVKRSKITQGERLLKDILLERGLQTQVVHFKLLLWQPISN